MRTHLLIFILLSILVIFLHFLLDSRYLGFGMHSDDWISLIRYRALEQDFLHKAQIFWRLYGPHATSQILYMGLLEGLFGLNYKTFALINIIFKILATLSLYPLALFFSKRRLFAFLAVLLYSISYSTVGTFHDVHKGTEYQAIFFMNIFLIIYLFLTKIQTLSLKWIFALILSFSMAILLAPPRLFPLTFLPLLIEFFTWLHNRTNYNLRFGVKKLFFLYLPFALLFIYHPVAVTGAFIVPITHFKKILEGYWFIILNPISGLGYMILWDGYWSKLIGSLGMDSFASYLNFLISHTLVVFGILSIIFGLILSKYKRRFIFLTIVLNFILEVLVFFLAINHLKIPLEKRISFDFNALLYSVFVGIFVIVFSISCYIEWLATAKKNELLLVLGLSPLISFYFIFCNWLFADSFLSFSPPHEYLTIPAIGVSLAFSALLTILYDKIKSIKILHLGNSLAFSALLLSFIPIYSISKTRTSGWLSAIVKQNNASMQQDIQQEIRKYVKEAGKKGNQLVFFDLTKDQLNGDFYSEILYSSFTSWMHLYNGKIIEGCINGITNRATLVNSISEKDGKKGFTTQGVCVETPSGDFFIKQEVFYGLKDFYAFEVNNNNLVDIRDNVLKDIGIN